MSNSLPPGKNVKSNITKFPTPGNDLWSRAQKKFKYPYPRNRKIIQMPYPRNKAISQNPALCPVSPPPPCQLDIDRCIIHLSMLCPRGAPPQDRMGTSIRNKNLESTLLTLWIRFQFKVPNLGEGFEFNVSHKTENFKPSEVKNMCSACI